MDFNRTCGKLVSTQNSRWHVFSRIENSSFDEAIKFIRYGQLFYMVNGINRFFRLMHYLHIFSLLKSFRKVILCYWVELANLAADLFLRLGHLLQKPDPFLYQWHHNLFSISLNSCQSFQKLMEIIERTK